MQVCRICVFFLIFIEKKLGVVKGPQPLKLIPALTTSASKRMKTQRFSHFAGFAARGAAAAGQLRPVSRGGASCFMPQAKPEKNSKKWSLATFSTLKSARFFTGAFVCSCQSLAFSSTYSLLVALLLFSYLSPQVMSMAYLPPSL